MEIQTTAWDIIVTSYIFIKILVVWMYKELLKLEETIHQRVYEEGK